MPSPPSVRAVLCRLVENQKSSVKVRLAALDRLHGMKVPLAMLERLLHNPDTPPRLLKAALDMFEAKATIRKWNRESGGHVPLALGTN
jgi:hypothetical protein